MNVTEFPSVSSDPNIKKALYLVIYDAIYQGIKKGKEGDKLPTETEFATYWHVSRGTIREAMYHLQEEGFIEKGRGHRSQISKDVASMGYHFQSRKNPILLAYSKIDTINVKHNLACCSNWLAEILQIAPGAPIVNVVTDYYYETHRLGTSMYLFPFSLVEKDICIPWNDNNAWVEFVKYGLYGKATSIKCSLCMLQEPIQDSELMYVSVPALLSEEFLFTDEICISFNRSYYDQGNPRIKFLRK